MTSSGTWRTVACRVAAACLALGRWVPSEAPRAAAQAIAPARQLTADEIAQVNAAGELSAKYVQLMSIGQPAESLAPALQAAEILRKVLGENHAEYAKALENVAYAYDQMGDHTRAEPLFLEVLELRRNIVGEKHEDYARTLNNLGELYRNEANYAQAEPLFRQAMEIWKTTGGEKSVVYATAVNNLGALYSSMGDYPRAIPMYRQAVDIVKAMEGENSVHYATSLNNLAYAHMMLGDYASAAPLYEQALAIDKALLGDKQPDYAMDLTNMGSMYFGLGDDERAASYYHQALSIITEFNERAAVAEDEAAQLATARKYQFYLNNVLSCLRNGKALEQSYDALLRWKGMTMVRQRATRLAAESPELAPTFAELQRVVGQWAMLSGSPPQDDPAWKQRLAEVTRRRDALEVELSRRSTAFRQAIEPPSTAMLQAVLPPDAVLVDYLEFARLQRVEVTRLAGLGANLELAADGAKVVMIVAGGSAAVDGRLQVGDVITGVAEAEGDYAALAGLPMDQVVAHIRGEAGTKFRLKVRRPSTGQAAAEQAAGEFDWTLTRTALPGAGTSRLVVTPALLAFVVRSGSVQAFELGELHSVWALIDAWRSTLGMSPESQQAAVTLRDRVWAPLAKAVGDAKVVLISPDGELGRFPFAAMPGAEPGRYLIDDVAVAMVPVPQLLPSLLTGASATKDLPTELLVLGGVDYDHHGDGAAAPGELARSNVVRPWQRRQMELAQRSVAGQDHWPFLPGTDSELGFIRDLYFEATKLPRDSNRVVSLRGAAATEEAFRRLAPQAYLLHLATHGFFAGKDKSPTAQSAAANTSADSGGGNATAAKGAPGLLSGLVLAGANVPPAIPDGAAAAGAMLDDGYLTADEIAMLPLGGAQLVVLSACESGLGQAARGQGTLGLQRAFQVAGAHATIASLWKVNDEATRRIMEEFYRNYLTKQMSPLAALREAQLWALNNPALVPRGADAPPDAQAATRLPPQFWAAFTLSGDWR